MKIIEVLTDAGYVDTILGVAEQYEVQDVWHYEISIDDRQVIRMLVSSENVQTILDSVQKVLGSAEVSRVVVLPVEATIPRYQDEKVRSKSKSSTSREALYQEVEKNTRLDRNYMFLVILSTIVAAVGLLENNIAVVIGAMVIAPLLGPNIALALGTVLGDRKLMSRAIVTFVLGIVIALMTAYAITFAYPVQEYSAELLSRTKVGISSVALALASGASGALSLTTGLSAILVGVMVAVAILPPAAAVGIMLGYEDLALATGAFLMLAINIVCINLSAIIVFLVKGIHPRTTGEKKQARSNSLVYFSIWILLLVILILFLYR